MAVLQAQMSCVFGDMYYNNIGLATPPIAWHACAEQINNESHSGTVGRYHKTHGETYQAPTLKRQDTFAVGTSGRTGRAFNVISGTWKSDTCFPNEDGYVLAMIDGNSTSAAEVVSATTTSNIEHACLRFDRDSPAVGNSANKGSGANFWYVQFAYGQMTDYRLYMDWHSPFRLDVTYDKGVTWQLGCAVTSQLGDVQHYLESNRHTVRITLQPDYDNDEFVLQVGEWNFLRHKPKKPANSLALGLPYVGNIRVVTQGSSMRFGYYPLRYPNPITLTKSPTKLTGEQVQNTAQAQTTVNARTATPPNQTTTTTFATQDGIAYTATVTASNVDSGDTLGAGSPARISDFTVYIPPTWTNAADGNPDGRIGELGLMRVDSMSLCDDVAQTITYSANLTANNYKGAYNGSYGRFASTLDLSNGYQWVRQCTGILGGKSGIHITREDPQRIMQTPFGDKWEQLCVPLNQEVDFDGWAWCAAMRFLLNAAGIHDMWLTFLPYWPPGVADASCPYYTLKRGSGLRPASLHYRQEIIWSICQEICQMLSGIDPITALPIPYYMGFDTLGNWHCEPLSFVSMQPSAFYSTRANATGGVQIERIEVFTSVADMRSSIDLFGIDPRSNELLYTHQPQSPAVLKAMGYRVPLTQQSPTFVSDAFMAYVAQTYQTQTSLPLLTCRIKAPMIPSTMAGQVVNVWADEVGGYCLFKLDQVITAAGYAGGGPVRDCFQVLDGRSLLNTL